MPLSPQFQFTYDTSSGVSLSPDLHYLLDFPSGRAFSPQLQALIDFSSGHSLSPNLDFIVMMGSSAVKGELGTVGLVSRGENGGGGLVHGES